MQDFKFVYSCARRCESCWRQHDASWTAKCPARAAPAVTAARPLRAYRCPQFCWTVSATAPARPSSATRPQTPIPQAQGALDNTFPPPPGAPTPGPPHRTTSPTAQRLFQRLLLRPGSRMLLVIRAVTLATYGRRATLVTPWRAGRRSKRLPQGDRPSRQPDMLSAATSKCKCGLLARQSLEPSAQPQRPGPRDWRRSPPRRKAHKLTIRRCMRRRPRAIDRP